MRRSSLVKAYRPTASILWTYEDYVLDDFVQTHAGYHDAENFENPARAEDQRNEVRLAFGVVWFRSLSNPDDRPSMIDFGVLAMDTILNEVCVLVTAAFALTLVPGFRRQERSLLSIRDQGTALLVFLVLGLVEETTVSHAGLLNERIVAVCAAGLVA